MGNLQITGCLRAGSPPFSQGSAEDPRSPRQQCLMAHKVPFTQKHLRSGWTHEGGNNFLQTPSRARERKTENSQQENKKQWQKSHSGLCVSLKCSSKTEGKAGMLLQVRWIFFNCGSSKGRAKPFPRKDTFKTVIV